MTTDHDPRELRSAAEWAKARDWGQLVLVPHNVNMLADYVLATVRDDDGEEQGDVTITQDRWRVRVQRLKASAWVTIDANGDGLSIPFLTFTRGQFRDLCRGLGITPAAATPETPG